MSEFFFICGGYFASLSYGNRLSSNHSPMQMVPPYKKTFLWQALTWSYFLKFSDFIYLKKTFKILKSFSVKSLFFNFTDMEDLES